MKYADAGVNIAVADDAKQRIRHLASKTFSPAVLGGIGGFGALFPWTASGGESRCSFRARMVWEPS